MSTVDIGNAFIQADNDEQILMLVRVKVAELMVRVSPPLYQPYIAYSKKSSSYVRCEIIEGPLWNAEGRSVILQETKKGSWKHGIQS